MNGMKFFGGLTVKDMRTGAYYRILGFSTYKTEKRIFCKPVSIPVYELVDLSDEGSHIRIDEKVLERAYQVIWIQEC